MEISRGAFRDGLNAFKKMPEVEFRKRYPLLADASYSKDKVEKALQKIYDEADPDNDEIRMDWF